jgi:AmmeMemoRadiSam system protein B
LVEGWIDRFYGTLENSSIDHIVLISPNHFNHGHSAIRTTDKAFAAQSSLLTNELTDFDLEHGISVHTPYLDSYFPHARVTPIMIKNGVQESRLNTLADELAELDPAHTLMLASIDFTHMDPEKVALENDDRTVAFLNDLSSTTLNLDRVINLAETTNPAPEWDSVAMDSPETLYVMARVMKAWNATTFELWARTSSASLIEGLTSMDNTSHVFGTFSQTSQ